MDERSATTTIKMGKCKHLLLFHQNQGVPNPLVRLAVIDLKEHTKLPIVHAPSAGKRPIEYEGNRSTHQAKTLETETFLAG